MADPALKKESYGALTPPEKHRLAREVARQVRPMLTAGEFDVIDVGFVELHTEGLIETSRTSTFSFPVR